jgi:hypothetical protein
MSYEYFTVDYIGQHSTWHVDGENTHEMFNTSHEAFNYLGSIKARLKMQTKNGVFVFERGAEVKGNGGQGGNLITIMNSLNFYLDLRQSDIDCIEADDYNGLWVACFYYKKNNKIGGPWSGKWGDKNTAIIMAATKALKWAIREGVEL